MKDGVWYASIRQQPNNRIELKKKPSRDHMYFNSIINLQAVSLLFDDGK